MPRYRKDASMEFVHQDIWILVTWEKNTFDERTKEVMRQNLYLIEFPFSLVASQMSAQSLQTKHEVTFNSLVLALKKDNLSFSDE